MVATGPGEQVTQTVKEAKSLYPNFDLEVLAKRLSSMKFGDMFRYPQVETGILNRFCQVAQKAVAATLYRSAYGHERSTLTLAQTVRAVLENKVDEVGAANTDIARAEIEIGAFSIDAPKLAQHFRDMGVPIPNEVTDLHTWARSIEESDKPDIDSNTGLYNRPIRLKSGDVRGIPTPVNEVQLEIDGATDGPCRPYLRFAKDIFVNGVADLLGQPTDQSVSMGTTSRAFAQTA